MTLNTDIYLNTKVPAKSIYEKVNQILGIPENRRWALRERGEYSWEVPGTWDYSNDLGQGFPAIVSVEFRKDTGVLAVDGECTVNCDEDENYHSHRPTHNVRVNLDTAYGFNHNGMNCSDLHAFVITRLYEWLNGRGDFHWQNEFTGEISENLNGIDDFGNAGDEAVSWFENIVKPAFAKEFIVERHPK